MAFRDIRRRRKWLSAEEIRLLALLAIVLAVMLAANIAAARLLPGGEWLFQRWSGARAFLFEVVEFSGGLWGGRVMPEGASQVLDSAAGPYTTEIAQRTQEIVYGRRAFSAEYTYVLNDPFFILMLYTPLALFSDFSVARAVWMLAAELALIGILVLALNLSEWSPPRWLYAVLIGVVLLQYFSLNALVTASPAIFLTFLYLCILLALRSLADEVAGILLALVAYQWEVGGLFFLFILFFALTNRRWGVLAGLGMALLVLLAISFLTNEGWGLPYLRAALSAWYRGESLTAGRVIAGWFPDLTLPLGRIVAAALGLLLFFESYDSVDAHFRRVVWTAAFTLAAMPLIGLPIFSSNHVVLTFPLILILALVWERWQRYRTVRVGLLLFIIVLVPLAMYYRVVSVYDPLMLEMIMVLPPLATILGLYWMRWWVLRSPQPWFGRPGGDR